MFDLELTWDRPAKINTQLSEHILRVRIIPKNISETTLPLQLAVAIDTSGSMQGTKWQQAKIACEQLIAQLRPDDRLSLAGFADWITPIAPNLQIGQIDKLRSLLEPLAPEGVTRTDLALDWIASALPPSPGRARIGILITDGHPTNELGTVSDDIQPLVRRAETMAAEGIMLSTVGLGNAEHFNTGLLVNLSDRGRGTFIYADTPALLGSQLQKRLHSIQKVAVETAILKVNLVPGVILKNCCQFRPDYLPLVQTAPQTIPLSKLQVDTPTDILLALEVSALNASQIPGNYAVGEIQLEVLDMSATGDISVTGETPVLRAIAPVELQFTPSYREAQKINPSADSDRLIWDINRFSTELAHTDDPLQTGELLGQIQAAAVKSRQMAIAEDAAEQFDNLKKTGKLNPHQTTGLLRASRQLGKS